MPSLSEILKSKSESKQQRTLNNRAARGQLSQMRDDALTGIASDPDLYARCITLFTCVRDERAYRWCVRGVEI